MNSSFIGHVSGSRGGALDVGGLASVDVVASTFSGNAALGAGGGAAFFGWLQGPARVQRCVLSSNRAGADGVAALEGAAQGLGGALFISLCASVSITDSVFQHNLAVQGGAIAINATAISHLEGLTLLGNNAREAGGAVLLAGADTGGAAGQAAGSDAGGALESAVVLFTKSALIANAAGASAHSAAAAGSGVVVAQRRRRLLQAAVQSETQAQADAASQTTGGVGGSVYVSGGASALLAGLNISNSLARVGAAIAADERCSSLPAAPGPQAAPAAPTTAALPSQVCGP